VFTRIRQRTSDVFRASTAWLHLVSICEKCKMTFTCSAVGSGAWLSGTIRKRAREREFIFFLSFFFFFPVYSHCVFNSAPDLVFSFDCVYLRLHSLACAFLSVIREYERWRDLGTIHVKELNNRLACFQYCVACSDRSSLCDVRSA